MADKKFRSSLFGGFNRDDVVKYIEKASEKTAEYRADSIKYHDLLLSNNELQASYDTLREEHEALCAEAEELRAALSEKEAELAALKEQLAEKQAVADEYTATKERLAAIEIEATKRAVEIEHAAEEKAAEVAEKCSQGLAKLKSEYLSASEDAEATAAHLLSETERISGRLNSLSTMLSDNAEAFSELEVR